MHLSAVENRAPRGSNEREAGEYESRMLQRYFAHLAKCERPEILDIGPISGNNISVFLSLGAKLSVCDFVLRLTNKMQVPGQELERALAIIDYRDCRFDSDTLCVPLNRHCWHIKR